LYILLFSLFLLAKTIASLVIYLNSYLLVCAATKTLKKMYTGLSDVDEKEYI